MTSISEDADVCNKQANDVRRSSLSICLGVCCQHFENPGRHFRQADVSTLGIPTKGYVKIMILAKQRWLVNSDCILVALNFFCKFWTYSACSAPSCIAKHPFFYKEISSNRPLS